MSPHPASPCLASLSPPLALAIFVSPLPYLCRLTLPRLPLASPHLTSPPLALAIFGVQMLADDIPINYAKMSSWSPAEARAYFENNGMMPSHLQGINSCAAEGCQPLPPLRLPYLISARLAPKRASDSDGWRGLRAATLRASAADHAKHGFAALGLPPGSLVSPCTCPTSHAPCPIYRAPNTPCAPCPTGHSPCTMHHAHTAG